MRTISKLILFLPATLFVINEASAQMSYGKIVYTRKTNLFKKFKDEDTRNWIKEENKNKVDVFELYFDDSLSVFKPQESELKEQLSWTTSKNTVYQNYKTSRRLSIKEIWGEKVYIADTVYKRQWKITDKHRNICGYDCQKAIWRPNDSTRIYAWFCNEIMTSTGPEGFFGLPGAIMGLATEDGGIVYFATSVEAKKPEVKDILPAKTKEKIYTPAELRTKMEKEFGKEKWGKELIKETFGFW
jgi:GLPGLI family protein